MSADVGCLGWQAESSDTILKKDHLEDHYIKVWSQLAKQFQREDFKKKNCLIFNF